MVNVVVVAAAAAVVLAGHVQARCCAPRFCTDPLQSSLDYFKGPSVLLAFPSFILKPPQAPSHCLWSSAMTHSFKRSSWYQEGALSLATGILYGGTNALVGHPMDTVKAKMQAQSGFMHGQGTSMRSVIQRIWYHEGIAGFFRGVVPPLLGSSLYRSTQVTLPLPQRLCVPFKCRSRTPLFSKGNSCCFV